jgi:hypothetical protein
LGMQLSPCKKFVAEKVAGDVIMHSHASSWMQRNLTRKERNPMKNAVRLIVLMLGLVTTYVALAAPMLPAPDGGPMPTCNPKTGCKPNGY